MSTLKTWAALAGLVAWAGAAQAALVNRGGGMIYDTTHDITWLADMNYAVTSGYAAANAGGTGVNRISADGRMGWNAASAWADTLIYGGFGDWRLPTVNPADSTCSGSFGVGLGFFGFNCTGGELSGLFVTDLGNKARESVLNQAGDTAEQIANFALFSNVRADEAYWSGLQYAPTPSLAWAFNPVDGSQNTASKSALLYAVAMRSGDVTASVPEPPTLALALLAMGAAVVARRKRRA